MWKDKPEGKEINGDFGKVKAKFPTLQLLKSAQDTLRFPST